MRGKNPFAGTTVGWPPPRASCCNAMTPLRLSVQKCQKRSGRAEMQSLGLALDKVREIQVHEWPSSSPLDLAQVCRLEASEIEVKFIAY